MSNDQQEVFVGRWTRELMGPRREEAEVNVQVWEHLGHEWQLEVTGIGPRRRATAGSIAARFLLGRKGGRGGWGLEG